jgi:hypothetical protein
MQKLGPTFKEKVLKLAFDKENEGVIFAVAARR